MYGGHAGQQRRLQSCQVSFFFELMDLKDDATLSGELEICFPFPLIILAIYRRHHYKTHEGNLIKL